MPETGETLVTVPESVPPGPALFRIASETWFAAVVTRLFRASRTSTCIGGAIDAPEAALAGWTTKFRFAGAPGFTTTVAVWVIPTPPIVADTVFDSATVEESVPVATPPAPDTPPAGWVSVFPVPVAARTTVAPKQIGRAPCRESVDAGDEDAA